MAAFALVGTLLGATNQQPATNSLPKLDTAARAETNYEADRTGFETLTNSAEAAWKFGRACFDLAALPNSNAKRAAFAQEGIAACRRAIQQKPDSAEAHYYLGMNIGQFADTKRNFAALRMVRDMEREFLAARDLNEHLDHAGPDRNLGLLYEEAPSIISIGSRSRARQHLQRAVELAPDYPENRLNLIEAYLKWGDRSNAERELKALETLWPDAQRKFQGDEWSASWIDWENRLNAIERKLGEPVKRPESPKQSN